jgi:hypothetical protein
MTVARCCWCGSVFGRWNLPGVPLDESPWLCPTLACKQRQLDWAMWTPGKGGKGIGTPLFVPLPRQVELMACGTRYRMIAGAAGPGKSKVGRNWLIRLGLAHAGFEALILRETLGEIRRTHLRRLTEEAPKFGLKPPTQTAPFELRFPNGSLIELGGMDDADAVERYLSAEYDVILADEAVKYDPEALLELSTRARTTKPAILAALGGSAVFAAVTNPGGPAQQILTDLFITKQPDYEALPGLKGKYQPAQWHVVPANLEDNPYLPPDYEDDLAILNPTRYKQLRHGDWFAMGGQFFPHFSAALHGRTVRPPVGCDWVEAMDWGYSSPGALGFFCHVGDNHWHCAKGFKFRGMEPPEVAALVKDTRKELGYERPRYGVADPSIQSEQRGESIQETFRRHHVYWQPALNRRSDTEKELGWPRLGAWFRPDPLTGIPWLTFDPAEASYLLRSIAALMPDKQNPEDVNTHLDDHGGDMTRYFVMSRPPLDYGQTITPIAPANSCGAILADLTPSTTVLGTDLVHA